MVNVLQKSEVLAALKIHLESRLSELQNYMNDLSTSLTSESKSTAGDKHDTGRAMIHLEQEKLHHQFEEVQLYLQRLNQLKDISSPLRNVGFGSFIKAEDYYFLAGIGLGKQIVQGQVIYCLGLETPIGKILKGKEVGESFSFAGKTIFIEVIS